MDGETELFFLLCFLFVVVVFKICITWFSELLAENIQAV